MEKDDADQCELSIFFPFFFFSFLHLRSTNDARNGCCVDDTATATFDHVHGRNLGALDDTNKVDVVDKSLGVV